MKFKDIFKRKNKKNIEETSAFPSFKQTPNQTEVNTKVKKQIDVKLLISSIGAVLSLFVTLCVFTKSIIFGSFGLGIYKLCLGLFGFISYPLFPMLLALSILKIIKKPIKIFKEANMKIAIIGMVCVFIFALHAVNSKEYFNLSFKEYIKTIYNAKEVTGIYSISGILVGAIVFLLQKGITRVGMFVLLGLVFVLFGLILTGIISKDISLKNFKIKNSFNFLKRKERVNNNIDQRDISNSLFVDNVREEESALNSNENSSFDIKPSEPAKDYSKTLDELTTQETLDVLYNKENYEYNNGSFIKKTNETVEPKKEDRRPINNNPITIPPSDLKNDVMPKKVVHGEETEKPKQRRRIFNQNPIRNFGEEATREQQAKQLEQERALNEQKKAELDNKVDNELEKEKLLRRVKENRERPIIDISKQKEEPHFEEPTPSEEPVTEEKLDFSFEDEINKTKEIFDSKTQNENLNSFQDKVDIKTGNIQYGIKSTYEDTIAPMPKKEINFEKAPINSKYYKPSDDLLDSLDSSNSVTEDEVKTNSEIIVKTLSEFQIDATFKNAVKGPTVTRYEFELAPGISVKRILGLSDDIHMRLSSEKSVRIEAPIPGKNLFGIEVPNKIKQFVGLKEIMHAIPMTKGKLKFAIGKDISGKSVICDLADAPHLLVAGRTGTGKSVCLNTLIVSLLFNYKPDDLKLILIDPKGGAEFAIYSGLPHMILQDTIIERSQVMKAFDWLIDEMENRYRKFNELGTDINSIELYNNSIDQNETRKMPYIVVIIDELADLMSQSKQDKSVFENKIQRLAQKSRAVGIHLVLATQRPSVDVITGVIKANLPTRIGLGTSSGTDSRTILDRNGCENLVAKGDMLYLNTNISSDPLRVQGAYVSRKEIKEIVDYIKKYNKSYYDQDIIDAITKEDEPEFNPNAAEDDGGSEGRDDDLFFKALKFGIACGSLSISSIETKYAVGFGKAKRIMMKIEEAGFIGKQEGAKPRPILLTEEKFKTLYPDQDINDY